MTSVLLRKQSSQAITAWSWWTKFTTELGLNPFLQALKDTVPVLQVLARRFMDAVGIWFPSAMLVSHLGYHALMHLLWCHQWPDYIKQ